MRPQVWQTLNAQVHITVGSRANSNLGLPTPSLASSPLYWLAMSFPSILAAISPKITVWFLAFDQGKDLIKCVLVEGSFYVLSIEDITEGKIDMIPILKKSVVVCHVIGLNINNPMNIYNIYHNFQQYIVIWLFV